jgi:PD-(D/E)XK nuclease superfamily
MEVMTTAAVERLTFNNSRIKVFQRCPKQYEYKYIQLIEPKKHARALLLGSWVHRALETYYTEGDWKVGHQEYVALWDKLFDEEKMDLRTRGRVIGPPFPEIVERIMRSYAWYYRNDGWKVIMVEKVIEAETPLRIGEKVVIFKGRLDLLMQDEEGLNWLWDHKTASTIPGPTSFHAMDPQLMMYPWAVERSMDLKIAGIVYNYVKSKPPSIPKLNKDGSLSRRKINTDYPTLYRFLKSNGYNPQDFAGVLRPLAKRSDFLRRYKLPREPYVTKEIVKDQLSIVKRIAETSRFTRNITRDCERCSYVDLCQAELNGFDTTILRDKNYQVTEEDYVVSDPGEVDGDDEDEEG